MRVLFLPAQRYRGFARHPVVVGIVRAMFYFNFFVKLYDTGFSTLITEMRFYLISRRSHSHDHTHTRDRAWLRAYAHDLAFSTREKTRMGVVRDRVWLWGPRVYKLDERPGSRLAASGQKLKPIKFNFCLFISIQFCKVHLQLNKFPSFNFCPVSLRYWFVVYNQW